MGDNSDLTGVNSAQLLFGGLESKADENEGFSKKVIVPKINKKYFLKVGAITFLKTWSKTR